MLTYDDDDVPSDFFSGLAIFVDDLRLMVFGCWICGAAAGGGGGCGDSIMCTNEKADCRFDVIGIKNGLERGDWKLDEDDDVERIDGTRMILVFAALEVLGSHEIGLKSISSVLILSGEEHSPFGDSIAAGELDAEESLIVTGVSLLGFVGTNCVEVLFSAAGSVFTRKVLFKSSVPRLNADRKIL